MKMEDWSNRLDDFLKLTDREILQDQLYISDFDKYIDELEKIENEGGNRN